MDPPPLAPGRCLTTVRGPPSARPIELHDFRKPHLPMNSVHCLADKHRPSQIDGAVREGDRVRGPIRHGFGHTAARPVTLILGICHPRKREVWPRSFLLDQCGRSATPLVSHQFRVSSAGWAADSTGPVSHSTGSGCTEGIGTWRTEPGLTRVCPSLQGRPHPSRRADLWLCQSTIQRHELRSWPALCRWCASRDRPVCAA